MDYLFCLSIPPFYGMGENEESVPLESLQYLQGEFTELEKEDHTIKIYPDCKHDLEDSKENSHL
jgi:esterase/lipase